MEESGEHLRSTLILWTVEITIEKMKLWRIEWCNRKSTNKVLTKKKPRTHQLAECFESHCKTLFLSWVNLLECLKSCKEGDTQNAQEKPRPLSCSQTYSSNWPGSFCDTDLNKDSVLLGPLFHDANNVFYLRITSALQKVQYFPQSLSTKVKSKDLSEG